MGIFAVTLQAKPKAGEITTEENQQECLNSYSDIDTFAKNLPMELTDEQKCDAIEDYQNKLKGKWLNFLDGNNPTTVPGKGVYPPPYLLPSAKDTETRNRYLKKLWEINQETLKTDEDKIAFATRFVRLFEKESEENEAAENISSVAQALNTVGIVFLIIVGTAFSSRYLFGARYTYYGYIVGSLLALGSLAESTIDFAKDLHGPDKGAQKVKYLLSHAAIMLITVLLIAAVIIEELSVVLTTGAPFGLGNFAKYILMALSLTAGVSFCISNLAMYRSLHKSAYGKTENTLIDDILNHSYFKKINIGINLFSCMASAVLIGFLLSNLLGPPGLGFAIGLIIGLAMLVQEHMLTLEKMGEIPTKNSITGWFYHALNNNPTLGTAFKVSITLLAAAGLFLIPFIAIPNLLSILPVTLPYLTAEIIGATVGLIAFIATLYPSYKDMEKNLAEAKVLDEAITEISTYNTEPSLKEKKEGEGKNLSQDQQADETVSKVEELLPKEKEEVRKLKRTLSYDSFFADKENTAKKDCNPSVSFMPSQAPV